MQRGRALERFLIDFMFARELVMLYPSFSKERCFSTTYMERGGTQARTPRRGDRFESSSPNLTLTLSLPLLTLTLT